MLGQRVEVMDAVPNLSTSGLSEDFSYLSGLLIPEIN